MYLVHRTINVPYTQAFVLVFIQSVSSYILPRIISFFLRKNAIPYFIYKNRFLGADLDGSIVKNTCYTGTRPWILIPSNTIKSQAWLDMCPHASEGRDRGNIKVLWLASTIASESFHVSKRPYYKEITKKITEEDIHKITVA